MIESKHHDKNRKNPKYCMKFLLFFQFSHWLWQGDKFVPRFIYSSLIRNETSDNQNRQIYRVHRSTAGFSKEVGTFVGPSLTSKYLTTRKFRNIHFHPVRLSGLISKCYFWVWILVWTISGTYSKLKSLNKMKFPFLVFPLLTGEDRKRKIE